MGYNYNYPAYKPPLITTHEPPSRYLGIRVSVLGMQGHFRCLHGNRPGFRALHLATEVGKRRNADEHSNGPQHFDLLFHDSSLREA